METEITDTVGELTARFLAFLPKFAAALILFVVGLYLASWLSRSVRQAMERRDADKEVTLFVAQLTRWGILTLFTVAALQQVDFNLTAFAAGLGIIGFTIGFALQDVSRNFVAGLLLLLQQPFELGDIIEVSGFTGRVITINLRATELSTLDGKAVQIPNGDVFTSPIVNMNRNPYRRVDVSMGVALTSDLEQVRLTALEAVARIPGLLQEPAPSLYFTKLDASTVEFTLYFWVNILENDPFKAKDNCLILLKKAFGREGIEVPLPIQRIQLHQTGG